MQSIAPKQPQKDNPNDWGQFNDVMEFFSSPITKSVAFIEFIGVFIFNILRIACVPAEVIFRRNFGERHFNLYLYIGSTLWLGIFAMGWLNLPAMFGYRGEGLVPNSIIFAVVALLFYVRMFWLMFLVKSGDIDVMMYSRYDGDPLSLLYKLPLANDSQGNPEEYRIRQLHEPVFLLLLGLVCTFLLNPQTGTWLMLSAFCLAVKEYAKSRHIRNMILDHIDAEIMSRNMAAVMKGQSTKTTQGVYFAGVSNEGKEREILHDLAAKKQQRFTAANA